MLILLCNCFNAEDGRGTMQVQGGVNSGISTRRSPAATELGEAATGATPTGDACNEEEGARALASMAGTC